MKTVVITGCLGFIGFHLTKKCLEKGYRVFGIDSETYAANTEVLGALLKVEKFSYLKSDISTLSKIPDCDYVINTAAETHVGNSIIDSDKFVQTNIEGVHNLLKKIALKPSNVNARPILMQVSTDEVYGDIVSGSHDEESSLNPSNPYSATKAAADLLIKSWNRTHGVDYIIVRPTNNYGPFQYPEKLIPICVKQLQRGKKIRLHDNGDPVRVWLHVEDTCEAIIKIMESGQKNEIFNVSGGFEQKNLITVKKILESFFKGVPWSTNKKHLDLTHSRKGQDVRYSIDDSKLRSLGWSPQRDFDEEIENIVKFYKNNFRW
tara:strand:- start:495 stop:1451 length:957 start_codon:yes stop_codon:yes gene_type:complete